MPTSLAGRTSGAGLQPARRFEIGVRWADCKPAGRLKEVAEKLQMRFPKAGRGPAPPRCTNGSQIRWRKPPTCEGVFQQSLKACPTESGVTLIEMLVVVSIIGLIVAVSAPSLGAGLDSVRMNSATNSVANFLNSAVNRAERRQTPIEVVISPRKATFTMYSTSRASSAS